MNPGDKVRVRPLDLARWNLTAARTLQGQEGVVEKIKPDWDFASGSRDRTGVLVSFDPPLPALSADASPVRAFWFSPPELEKLP